MNRINVIPASYLILLKDNQILLSRRFNTGYEDGTYSLVAGHLEENETFMECLIREAQEEIGIEINPNQAKISHIMHRKTDPSFPNRIDKFYTVSNWKGDIKNLEPNKCDDISWHDINNLPPNIIPYIKFAIESSLNNKKHSEYGWSN